MSDQEEDQGDDIKDLEFRLTHDLNQLQVSRMCEMMSVTVSVIFSQ